MSVLDKAIRILAPYDCLACGQEGDLLCPGCLRVLPSAPGQALALASLDRIQAATAYQGAAKELVWKLKSSGARSAAKIMALLIAQRLDLPREALFVPVPTVTGRIRQRGYNQAQLLTKELSRHVGMPWAACLARSGQAHQVGATREQRLLQLVKALRVTRPALVYKRHIILIDDVVTTGATLETAAAALRIAGSLTVEAVTFAQPRLRLLE